MKHASNVAIELIPADSLSVRVGYDEDRWVLYVRMWTKKCTNALSAKERLHRLAEREVYRLVCEQPSDHQTLL